ncbi:MAG: alcohol dehydrogenase, partial [Legionella sp. 40-6]
MHAMVMKNINEKLIYTQVEKPSPNPQQILIKITACGICRTDLHVVDGELKHPKLPLIPGHQIVGIIEALGKEVHSFTIGQRVGVPWLGGSCGHCSFCLTGRENLCEEAQFTGYQIDGGFAQYCVANQQFCFPIPAMYSDAQAAPLFCAGLIGYRALLKTMEAKHLGLYGFGSAAHILTQVACKQGRQVYAFTTPGDLKAQQFAYQLGATWAGDANQSPPHLL